MENKKETILVFEFDECCMIENKISKGTIELLKKEQNVFSYYTIVKLEFESENIISYF